MITGTPAPHELNLNEEHDRHTIARQCLAYACLFTAQPFPAEALTAEQMEDARRPRRHRGRTLRPHGRPLSP